MHDASRSYRRRYDYRHPTARRARAEGLARSGHTCQRCGDQEATEGHHWVYPPEEKTTADHVTGLCPTCHDVLTWVIWFVSFGGSRQLLAEHLPVFLAQLLDRRDRPETGRVGRARRIGHAWGAVVSGLSRPRPGEAIAVLLRCSGQWRRFAVVDIVGGRPGAWRVRTRWLRGRGAPPVCVINSARRNRPQPR